MTESKLCELCGDAYHDLADTEEWLGLYCPGAAGTAAAKESYRSALTTTFAQYWEQECRHFFAWEDGREERNAAWDGRERADGRIKEQLPETAQVSGALQADCDIHTTDELARQHRDQVFAPFGGFEVDIAHLTTVGQVPIRPPIVRTAAERKTKSDPTDALLFMGDAEDQ